MAQTITFRPVTPDELPTVLAIYDRARKFMAAHGNPRQWNTTWPTRNLMSWPDKIRFAKFARGWYNSCNCAVPCAGKVRS